MPKKILLALLVLISAVAILSSSALSQVPGNIEDLRSKFQNPPDDSRIMMRWWWFGPAVTKEEIARELLAMKDAGIGGVEIQPVYPVSLDTDKLSSAPYLSEKFIELVRFANSVAATLGLRVDITLGSGWPYGGPSVSVNDAAGKLRIEKAKVDPTDKSVRLPQLSDGEDLIAGFLLSPNGESRRIAASPSNGRLALPGTRNQVQEVQFFISSRTGMQVKRASVGAEGFVVNHYDAGALQRYLTSAADRLIQAFDQKKPVAVFCDSLEVFQSDWTPDLLEQFKIRRGYDLLPLLPEMTGKDTTAAKGLRHDWGLTLSELYRERFLAPLSEWAHKHGTRLRIQGYGTPPMTMSANALADYPEGEGFNWKAVTATRWAASASHIYGKPVTSSETWTWLHSPSFRATPLDIKAEADLHFLQGINQLIGHGFPYSDPGADYPGWKFYAAAALNDKNPWWQVMPDLSRYLQRLSYILRQGSPANNVALYLPTHDALAMVNGGKTNLFENIRDLVGPDFLPNLISEGFNPEFVDDEVIGKSVIADKTLRTANTAYKAIILPSIERIPVDVINRISAFAAEGGIVIVTDKTPFLAPGYQAKDDTTVKDLAAKLIASGGLLATKAEVGKALASRLTPELRFSSGKQELGYLKRHLGFADVYFIANTSNQYLSTEASFGKTGLSPEVWNPISGTVEQADYSRGASGELAVRLKLAPYESVVIVLSGRKTDPLVQKASEWRELKDAWQLTATANGKELRISQPSPAAWPLDGEMAYFSGVASYETSFDFTPSQQARVFLDLGPGRSLEPQKRVNGMQVWYEAPVRESAVIYVNGKRAGSLWSAPYRLEIGSLLKSGKNQLRIDVGNTAINAMAGRALPNRKLLSLRYGERFQDQDVNNLQPIVSGITGQVRLLIER